MREIKFRTWDTENKEFSEWTNRDPFFSTSSGSIFFWERTQKEDGTFGGDVVLADLGGRFILEQYTGLKDKNGKEVYEGDVMEILKYPSPYGYNPEGEAERIIGVVTFQDGIFAARWGQENCNKEYIGSGSVIGNIHENNER